MSDQNIFIHLLAGGLAGTTGSILTCPLEVVKTRLQASQTCGNNNLVAKPLAQLKPSSIIIHSSQQLTLPKSTSSKFKNLNTNSPRLQSYSNIMFRNSHGATTMNNNLLANEFNFASHLNNHFKQTKHSHNIEYTIRNQNKLKLGKNIYLSFKSIVENEGIKGLFKGLGPTIIGVAPYRAIYFFTYANSKSYLTKKLGEERSILHVISAFIAGFSAVSITNPIWFVKTRLQLDQSRRGQTAIEVINKILKEKGPLGFYKGISASYFGISESALYFVIYEKLKHLSANYSETENLSLFTYFTSAGFSKTLASVLCYPHEVARTRLRQEGNKYTGFFQTLNLVVHEEGIRGIYKGMATHMIRQIPNTAIVMTTYEVIVHYFNKNDHSYPLANDDE